MKDKLNITVFLAALALLIVFVFVLPSDPEAPEYENRSMAEMPPLSAAGLLDGSFWDGLESYLSDSAAHRTTLLQIAADMERAYGLRAPGAVLVDLSESDMGLGLIPDVDDEDLYIEMPDPGEAHASNPQTGGTTGAESDGTGGAPEGSYGGMPEVPAGDNTETSEPPGGDPDGQPGLTAGEPDEDAGPAADEDPPQSPGHGQTPTQPVPVENAERPAGERVDPTKPFGVDFNHNDDAILYERYRENSRAVRRYAEILNIYSGRLPEDVRIFSMLAPIRVEFMGERYASSNDSQRDTIDKINDILDERIIRTATYEKLSAHADEYIYFRTDHHWTALGAYYAYLSFAEAAGFEPIGIGNYIEHSIPGFLGSFGRGTQNRTVRDHPDTMYYYVLDNGTTFTRRFFVIPQDMSRLSYRVFMGGDYAKLDYTSSNTNGNTLVVVKDSYANALIPWLSPHYERIIVIDPRQYGGSVARLLGDFENADLLFMNYVAATSMADFIEMIYKVR